MSFEHCTRGRIIVGRESFQCLVVYCFATFEFGEGNGLDQVLHIGASKMQKQGFLPLRGGDSGGRNVVRETSHPFLPSFRRADVERQRGREVESGSHYPRRQFYVSVC